MPYIRQNERDNIDVAFQREMAQGSFDGTKPPRGKWELVASTMNPGQLNYLITRFVLAYAKYSPSYQSVNDVLGVLDAVAREFYRRGVAPYEDVKIKENGDVY